MGGAACPFVLIFRFLPQPAKKIAGHAPKFIENVPASANLRARSVRCNKYFSFRTNRPYAETSECAVREKLQHEFQKPASNARNLFSNSHCCFAFSLAFRNSEHPFDGISLPSVSFAQSFTAREKLSCFSHKL